MIPPKRNIYEPHDVYGGHYRNKPDKKKILFIRKDQILGTIDASIELVAMTHTKDDGSPMPVFENVMNKQKALLDQWIDRYVDKAKERMSAYVVVPVQKATMNAKRDWQEREIHLSFPWGWDETTFDNLSTAVHNYIVNSVLTEFFIMTITSKDPITADKKSLADEAYEDIKRYTMVRLPGVTRKKLHPF